MATTIEDNKKLELILDLVSDITREKHLDVYDFKQLEVFLGLIGPDLREGKLTEDLLASLYSNFDEEFLASTLQGRSFKKPNGYSGDYLLLDKIYTRQVSLDPEYGKWDQYFQQLSVPITIRNRKSYFKELVISRASLNPDLKILNVCSGSGRELLELYHKLPYGNNVRTTCVELDGEAIAYSKELNKNNLQKISYVHGNIFSCPNEEVYDVIWVSGLADYLDDRALMELLIRLKGWMASGGMLVLGNCNDANDPERDYLEIFGQWILARRNQGQLYNLAKKAGFAQNDIKIKEGKDKTTIYLHLQIS